MLDIRPIQLEGFILRAGEAEVVGTPTRPAIEHALKVSEAMNAAAGYWIGDILAHVAGRKDLSDVIEEIMSVTKLSRASLHKKLYVARHVDVEMRKESPSESHSAQVAALDPVVQRRLLQKATAEELTVIELRQHVKAATRPSIIEGQAKLQGKYRIIYADPPWRYRDSNPHLDGSHTKAEQVFPTMTIEQLCKLPVSAHSMRGSLLAMWVTSPMLWESPGPREVMAAWGFKYKAERVWHKVRGNPGHYGMQVEHEHLMIGVRGSCPPDVPTPQESSILTVRRSNVNSQKPEEMRQYLTRHWTTGPYLELFGRKPVEGWTVFGNDARLWE